MKPKLETVQNWSRWCECHNGALPIFDLTGYTCQACGQIVCVDCIYETEKGFICADCITKLKPKKIIPLNSQKSQVKTKYLRRVILLEVIAFAFVILSYLFLSQIEIITILSLISLLVGSALIFIIALKEILKKNKPQISEKETKKLDKKILKLKN